MSEENILLLGSIQIEKIYENGEFSYLKFKDLEDPEYSWIERFNGDKKWYLNDKLHREDGPAIERSNGDKFWFLNGKHHREGGPAAEYANGDKFWYLNDKRHREGGPACEWTDGYKEWWLNGKRLTEEDHRKQTKA